MKTEALRKCFQLIEFLNELTGKERAKYLRHATSTVIKFLTDICYNILLGNIKLSPKILTKLKTERRLIEAICEKNISLKKRRKILLKKDFFLNVIRPVIRRLRVHYGVQ